MKKTKREKQKMTIIMKKKTMMKINMVKMMRKRRMKMKLKRKKILMKKKFILREIEKVEKEIKTNAVIAVKVVIMNWKVKSIMKNRKMRINIIIMKISEISDLKQLMLILIIKKYKILINNNPHMIISKKILYLW